MKYIFLLSGENIKIAAAEAMAFSKGGILDGRLLTADYYGNPSKLERLAYTKKIYKFLFSCKENELIKQMKKFNWNSIYRRSFSLRIFNGKKDSKFSEKGLAVIVWNSVKKPKVDLENAKTKIGIFFSKRVYCGTLLFKLKGNFEKRKPHLKPGFAPVSLNPKLARAMVNLSGAKNKIICDPFCGVGGILVEAGLLGYKVIGYDFDEKMLEKCKENLKFYKINNYELKKKNALEIKDKYNYIVTDLPYGKSSKVLGEALYRNFIKHLKKILIKRAVIGFPDSDNYKKLLKSEGFKIKNEFNYYIHKSLTKKIFVIEKKG